MNNAPRILVVAATGRELAEPGDWLTLECGVGPVDAAAITAAAIARIQPDVIVHVGIAGVRRSSGLELGSLVIGTEARYCDLDVPEEWAPRTVVAAPALVRAARRALPNARALAIGTSGRVGGTAGGAARSATGSATRCDVEAMEGFGVLRAAELAGTPAVEVRAVSNIIEEPDRGLWRFDEAFAAIVAATPLLVQELKRELAHA
jgi:futalosine hydrolase